MSKEFLTISDGTFTLSETENENQFRFYRNDGGVLGDIGNEPIRMYQAYILKKMMKEKITEPIMGNIISETSIDGKFIRLFISEIGKKPVMKSSSVNKKKSSFFKRLFNKNFK